MEAKRTGCLAELVGTFALVFIGAGSVAVQGWSGGAVSLVGIALAHGLTLMAMIYAFGHISGTHINPAVTISMIVTGKMNVTLGIQYLVYQLVGAGIAGYVLRVIFPDLPNALGTTDLAMGISPGTGFLVEAVLTFFLVSVVFGAAVDDRAPKGFAGLAIGMTLTLGILMGGALTGASLNPARTFGPALASGHWNNHWIYWAGPIVGGVVAAVLNQSVFQKTHR